MVGFLGAVVAAAIVLISTSSIVLVESSITTFSKAFKPLYGESNIVSYEDEGSVEIAMDEATSSGFHSKEMYVQGYFETSLRLPESYTAGVVVTFYASNNQKYPYRHDEIDLEFLGRARGGTWSLQTNFYGGGHVERGREERYDLWFDPSEDSHRYAIRWGPDRITYYVDGVPIRHVAKAPAMRAEFPNKEMRLYGTIWNGSDWATGGGRYKMDMSYGPFVAKYSGFVMNGCPFNGTGPRDCVDRGLTLTREERLKMNGFRRRWMTYSYCYDIKRYPLSLPECVFNSRELRHLQKLHPKTFGYSKNSN
ncbi:probable xyloglucan endotransglucosylase/hydrolase protein 27 [Salvia miltiorrhiza]|uniref:probable xyloglucan endotransglucosylase/hydrolase protein 27 n=1 Tax=Salvia miltiorrhiza TaxID=226208 RepID=UPI0025AC810F|nr:probable xyloglucan endotransglucosylase/hydrolase protein 27 [Salvia miltiorrhiza]